MASQWILYALLSALFAGLVAVFSKIGLKNVDTNLATTVRAFIMFLFLIIIILIQKRFSLITQFRTGDYIFIILAGIAGALSWLFYFIALKSGEATKVASLDRLSIIFVMVFALLFLGERFSIKVLAGVVLIVIGAILMIV